MKKFKIALVAAGTLILAGCGNQVATNNNQPGVQTQNTPTADVEKGADNSGGGIISSIKDAIASGKAMKCTYTIKTGTTDFTTTVYINGKNYRTQTQVAGKTENMLFSEDAMYLWAQDQKQGTKITTSCSEELAKNAPKTDNANVPAPDSSGQKTFDSATNVSCVPDNGGDFTVPADVTFADQCESLKNVMKNIPGGVKLPKGVQLPGGAALQP